MGGWAARRTARLFIQLSPRERAELEALASRDGRTLTSTVVGLVTRAHAIAVAEGSLTPVSILPGGEVETDMSRIKRKLRIGDSRKKRGGR